MLALGRTTILLQLLLLAVGLAISLAPARAAGEPHYIVHVILEPASREVQVRMSVRLPIGAEQRFGLDRGFAVKTIEIAFAGSRGAACLVGQRGGCRL